MKRKIVITFIVIFVCFSFNNYVFAAPFGMLGARAMGMGGAFTAMSDDLTSVYWNPAGLGFLNTIDISMPYGKFSRDRGNTENALQRFQDSFFSANLPSLVSQFKENNMTISGDNSIGFIFGMPGFGLSLIDRDFISITPYWVKKSDTDLGKTPKNPSYLQYSALETNNYTFTICYGQASHGYFFGVNANYIEYKGYFQQEYISLLNKIDIPTLLDDALNGSKENDRLWSFDAGLMIFMGTYRLGLVAKNVNSPEFKIPSDREITFEPQYRLGFAMPITTGMIVDIDYDLQKNKMFDSDLKEQELAIGTEMQFAGGRYRLRVGGHKNLAYQGSPFNYALGAGLTMGIFKFDTAGSINQDNTIWNWSGMITLSFK